VNCRLTPRDGTPEEVTAKVNSRTSAAKAGDEKKALNAALKRCSTQKPGFFRGTPEGVP
jgi:hypothetical protein